MFYDQISVLHLSGLALVVMEHNGTIEMYHSFVSMYYCAAATSAIRLQSVKAIILKFMSILRWTGNYSKPLIDIAKEIRSLVFDVQFKITAEFCF